MHVVLAVRDDSFEYESHLQCFTFPEFEFDFTNRPFLVCAAPTFIC